MLNVIESKQRRIKEVKNEDGLKVLNREYYHKHKIRLNRDNTARRRAGIIRTDMLRKREWTRKWRKRPDYRAKERLYCQRVNVKIKRNLSRRIRRALMNNQKSARTVQLLGCSIDQLKVFLPRSLRRRCTGRTTGLTGTSIITSRVPLTIFLILKSRTAASTGAIFAH